MNDRPKMLTRERAREYLLEVWGVELSTSALANWATQSAGPRYAVIGRRAYYRVTDLDEWIEAQIEEAS